ncbi:phosphate ABC transporter substrate-binding protein, PhoT family [Mariprofundus ferrinatatus]|uniref:Phosphate ABC transporter substrate-binding protein, PhoT family n=1 Tax=Mariprofundus ferrinatatus TaxID=1921087 RepID=A0A2K8L5J2_9PROT|nr:substrate-binding domain-containing protein [Mariprofundus ferrinatatus]ATX81509.1 phosphate ABC transporter substrate-binding protein, PhoT family [Mariprofundus ferrinatatus]
MKKMILATAAFLLGATAAQAGEQIHIVGSSTVYPFSSYVAEELGATTNLKTPVVESTGSGGGMKLFCAGNGSDTPDFTNASRRMKDKEYTTCQENGVKYITEAVIGYDGLAIAQSKSAPAFNITRKEMMLAVAAEVPNKEGNALIANPYHYWDEINPKFPHRKITVYGPPTSSGTRDAFEDMILKGVCKKMDVYTNLYKADKVKNKKYKKYHGIRQDGVYVPSGENDNLIVQKLTKDTEALGIFGYSYLVENADRIGAATIEGIAPAPETVQDGSYKLSRSLYFYIKHANQKHADGMMDYANLFMSEKMIGDDGMLSEIGLIPLPEAMRETYRNNVKNLVRMTADTLKK